MRSSSGRSQLHDPALIHQANLIAHFKGFLNIMRYHNNGFTSKFVQFHEFFSDAVSV